MQDSPVIYVDADACPVKDEVYRVAERYGLNVKVVANAWMRTPSALPQSAAGRGSVEMVVVAEGPDAADDWIAERAGPGDIVVTTDIPLADRALKAGAQPLSPKGKPFTADSIGGALAQRAVMDHLRGMGEITGGPAAFASADRSRFLQALDEAVVRARRICQESRTRGVSP
jgi:uncharacterized protein YaiI (UPF0178 family)